MLKSITLALLVGSLFGADQAPPKVADTIYDKAVADNIKDAQRGYEAYQKALELANQKILKSLEAAKTDLNNPQKGKLTIKERSQAIDEIDTKIASLKAGALADLVVQKAKEGLMGDGGNGKIDENKYLGTFTTNELGDFSIQMKDGSLYLTELSTSNHSVSSKIIDGTVVFQWSNNNGILVAKVIKPTVTLNYYSKAYKGSLIVPQTSPSWSYQGKFK